MDDNLKDVVKDMIADLPEDTRARMIAMLEDILRKSVNSDLKQLFSGAMPEENRSAALARVKDLMVDRAFIDVDVADEILKRVLQQPGQPAGAAPADPEQIPAGYHSILEDGGRVLKRLRAFADKLGVNAFPMVMVFVKGGEDGLTAGSAAHQLGTAMGLLAQITQDAEGVEVPVHLAERLEAIDQYVNDNKRHWTTVNVDLH